MRMTANTNLVEQEANRKAAEEEKARKAAEAEAKIKVGDDPTTPVDDRHAAVHPDTSPEAKAPLLAEHLPAPEDAYAQDPPPAREPGPAEAQTPPQVIVDPSAKPPAFDARGQPVNQPEPEEPAAKRNG
jgi:hypothetical protein